MVRWKEIIWVFDLHDEQLILSFLVQDNQKSRYKLYSFRV